jgi:hypothetical protein
MDHSEETTELEAALDKFQDTSGFVKATKENPYHKNKYADYTVIVTKTRPELKQQGLRVKQAVVNIDGKAGIFTLLKHTSGQWMSSSSPCTYKEGDPQSQGSAITYMKRYAYATMLDLLVDADDDGNLAAGVGAVADKKLAAAEFMAEKAKMVKTLRNEKNMPIAEVHQLVKTTLKKDRVETHEDIQKILTAAGVQ